MQTVSHFIFGVADVFFWATTALLVGLSALQLVMLAGRKRTVSQVLRAMAVPIAVFALLVVGKYVMVPMVDRAAQTSGAGGISEGSR